LPLLRAFYFAYMQYFLSRFSNPALATFRHSRIDFRILNRMEMLNLSNYGETLALATAIFWAIAVILFKKSGETVGPLGLNLFKNTLTLLLIPPTMLVFGQTLFRSASLNDYALLILSGVLGIGIADTLFFKSLNLLGAARSAIVDCLYSPVIIALSVIWLGERLTVAQAIGALVIVSAVFAIGREKGLVQITRHQLIGGILLGADHGDRHCHDQAASGKVPGSVGN
jgi:drug/metabolite transporter (DMT)-like permease